MSNLHSGPEYGGTHSQKVRVVAGYALQQRLGSGSFATVYKGVRVPASKELGTETTDDTPHPEIVAIKAIARTSEKLTKKVLQNLEIEISILRTYRHPNIVCMHDVQKTERHFYLILEYCGGGDVQGLIRTRKAKRLSERLTRRLMRDLSAGLKFLWGQELIHRDIKPQNLLLSGPLPLDEVNDPDSTPEEEAKRRQANSPSKDFSLKIADFGFARHLQTASLAETLCGSPLYMAPEILQHHRYDAKADLWSVGTVLFEMIAGRPPFNGENHIDLLRNIQRKAVRLPPDVRVSKACVNLLRLLLNRNPLSRAGFKEFFEACDAFVALGCQGVGTTDSGTCRIPNRDLGTIPENDGDNTSPAPGSESLETIETSAPPPQQQQQPNRPQHRQAQFPAPTYTAQGQVRNTRIVSPQFSALPTPPAVIPSAPLMDKPQSLVHHPNRLSPLTQSPPTSGQAVNPNANVPEILSLGAQQRQHWPQTTNANEMVQTNRRTEMSQSQSTDESGFVMVEHGIPSRPDLYDPSGQPTYGDRRGPDIRQPSQGTPQFYSNPPPQMPGRVDFSAMPRSSSKGMLSTSPGTGGILMGLVARARLGQEAPSADASLGEEIAAANKMIATAEDVGRRAVSVAHLGDTRAYLGMRLVHVNDSGSSDLSALPMEGVEEETRNDAKGGVPNDSTEMMTTTRRRSAVSVDKVMADVRTDVGESEEMPFAVSPETPTVALPSRSGSVSVFHKGSSMSSAKKGPSKTDPSTIRAHFGEALSCYLKALTMLKSSVRAALKVTKDLENLSAHVGRSPTQYDIPNMRARSEVTSNWLSQQFNGVLERADAASAEIAKLRQEPGGQEAPAVTSVEELIYNYSLASGRDGSVKQLLGQYEAARASYRTAGLLAETLLMEANISTEDRRILEGYVDGFAARITELDQLMLQKSRMVGSTNPASSNRSSGVIGLIGPPPAAPTGFLVGSPR